MKDIEYWEELSATGIVWFKQEIFTVSLLISLAIPLEIFDS